MSRIYVVTSRKGGDVVRYVRAHTLNAAIRAAAAELFQSEALTTDQMYRAMQAGKFDVLDSIEPTQVDLDDKDDPGPVPLRVAK